MSDNLNFLCGARARSTVRRAEREVARLRRKVGVWSGDVIRAEPSCSWGLWLCSGLICTAV